MALFFTSIFLFSLLALAISQNPNYNDIEGSFTGTCASNPSDGVQSPGILQDTLCAGYENFNLTMSNLLAIGNQITVDANVGSLVVDYNNLKLSLFGQTYTSQSVTVRNPAENTLFSVNNTANLELQIFMTQDSNGRQAVLSFLVQSTTVNGTIDTGRSLALNNLNVIRSLNATNWDIRFLDLQTAISNKLAAFAFLNLFTYNGTLTFPPCTPATWFIYGTYLYTTQSVIDGFTNALSSSSISGELNNGSNARPINGTGGGAGNVYALRLCFTNTFEVYMNYDYGLWFGIVIILIFFIITLSINDKPIKGENYQESPWTNHPIVSIYLVGNPIYTRKSRSALLLTTISLYAMFNAIFYKASDNRTRGSNIIVFAVYSLLCGLFVSYFLGMVLRWYYIAKSKFYKTHDVKWEQHSQNRIFAFYFLVFLLLIIAWPICVWQMYGLEAQVDNQPSNFWVASFFTSVGLELLIIAPLICLLAKYVGFMRTFAKQKGYMYDTLCHETYLNYLKVD